LQPVSAAHGGVEPLSGGRRTLRLGTPSQDHEAGSNRHGDEQEWKRKSARERKSRRSHRQAKPNASALTPPEPGPGYDVERADRDEPRPQEYEAIPAEPLEWTTERPKSPWRHRQLAGPGEMRQGDRHRDAEPGVGHIGNRRKSEAETSNVHGHWPPLSDD
jgi:hypothetical protein